MTMYTASNTRRAKVYDVDTKEELKQVASIDTETGEAVVFRHPLKITADGEAETYKVRYRTISPIFGGYPVPCLFHCYGRLA